MLDRKKKNYTILGIALINMIAIIVVLLKLITKKSIPINFLASDLVDKMCSKNMLLFLPIIVLAISLIQVMYRKKTMYKTITTARLIEDGLFAFVDGLLITSNWLLVVIGYNFEKTSLISTNIIKPFYLLIIFIGLVIAGIASTFPINHYGSNLGLRTKETMKDDKIWRRANRFNGFTMFIASIIIILLGFDFIIKGFKLVLFISTLLISLILIFIFPRIYLSIKKSREETIE